MQVLDDNKKLCLVSGEIIQLSSTMTMMFEVEDLSVASPATVSRCGMVYMEPSSLGIDPLLTAWLERVGAGPLHAHCAMLKAISCALMPPLIRFMRRGPVRETVTSVDHNLALSCFNVMDAMTPELLSRVGPDTAAGDAGAAVAATMLFSVVWSIGATCDRASRAAFDAELRSLVSRAGCVLSWHAQTRIGARPMRGVWR